MAETSLGFFCVSRWHLGVRRKPKMGYFAPWVQVFI
jgi:hypothetical protein